MVRNTGSAERHRKLGETRKLGEIRGVRDTGSGERHRKLGEIRGVRDTKAERDRKQRYKPVNPKGNQP